MMGLVEQLKDIIVVRDAMGWYRIVCAAVRRWHRMELIGGGRVGRKGRDRIDGWLNG